MIINTSEFTNDDFLKNLEKVFPTAKFEYFIESVEMEKNDSLLDLLAIIYPELSRVTSYKSLKNNILKTKNSTHCKYEMNHNRLKLTLINSTVEVIFQIDEETISITANENYYLKSHMDFNDKRINLKNHQTENNYKDFYKFFLISFFLDDIDDMCKRNLIDFDFNKEDALTLLSRLDDLENTIYLKEMIVL